MKETQLAWITFCCSTIGMCFPLSAKDFGIMGETFPIQEISLLSFLRERTSGFHKRLDVSLIEEAKSPKRNPLIATTTTSRTFLIDPSFVVSKDIGDGQGHVLAKAGTVVNPLDKIKLSSGLLFFDGNKQAHLEWARKQEGCFKWILIDGKPIDLEELERHPVYFDQAGIYATRFQIKNAPARVTQNGRFLLVEELALNERGEEL